MKINFYRKLFWLSYRWGHTGITKKWKVRVYEKKNISDRLYKIFFWRFYKWQRRETTIKNKNLNFVKKSFVLKQRFYIKFTQSSIKFKVMKIFSHEISFLHNIILKILPMEYTARMVKYKNLKLFPKKKNSKVLSRKNNLKTVSMKVNSIYKKHKT